MRAGPSNNTRNKGLNFKLQETRSTMKGNRNILDLARLMMMMMMMTMMMMRLFVTQFTVRDEL